MPLYDVLRKAADRLNSGHLSNEAQVKQAVILPILRNLEWDDTDPSQFKPEYSVRNRFVDYALFTPDGPRVFVEAKRIGALDSSGETQLFSYAAHEGIPFLILTDGNQWKFYLSMAAGKPPERCFLSLRISDLAAQKENERRLERVLRRANVESGSAWRFANELLDARQKRERGLKAIPEAWQRLVEEPHHSLKELLAEKVHELSGVKPSATDVAEFLRGFQSAHVSSRKINEAKFVKRDTRTRGRKLVGFQLDNRTTQPGTAIGTLVALVQHLARYDAQFMEQFANQTASRTRRLIARNRMDLYDNPKLCETSAKDLGNGWWLGSNLSAAEIRKRIDKAREISGVGSRLVLIEE